MFSLGGCGGGDDEHAAAKVAASAEPASDHRRTLRSGCEIMNLSLRELKMRLHCARSRRTAIGPEAQRAVSPGSAAARRTSARADATSRRLLHARTIRS